MSNKIVYTGLVTPIELHNVKMVEIAPLNETAPLIDVRKEADTTFAELTKANNYTGNQLIFIQSYCAMNDTDFAKLLNKSEKELAKLLDTDNEAAGLDNKTEDLLKQHMLQFKKSITQSHSTFFHPQDKSSPDAPKDEGPKNKP